MNRLNFAVWLMGVVAPAVSFAQSPSVNDLVSCAELVSQFDPALKERFAVVEGGCFGETTAFGFIPTKVRYLVLDRQGPFVRIATEDGVLRYRVDGIPEKFQWQDPKTGDTWIRISRGGNSGTPALRITRAGSISILTDTDKPEIRNSVARLEALEEADFQSGYPVAAVEALTFTGLKDSAAKVRANHLKAVSENELENQKFDRETAARKQRIDAYIAELRAAFTNPDTDDRALMKESFVAEGLIHRIRDHLRQQGEPCPKVSESLHDAPAPDRACLEFIQKGQAKGFQLPEAALPEKPRLISAMSPDEYKRLITSCTKLPAPGLKEIAERELQLISIEDAKKAVTKGNGNSSTGD